MTITTTNTGGNEWELKTSIGWNAFATKAEKESAESTLQTEVNNHLATYPLARIKTVDVNGVQIGNYPRHRA